MSSLYSPQFIDLCRVQLALLRDNLGAEMGIVYTAQTTADGQEPKLEPLVSYPAENNIVWPEDWGISKLLAGSETEPDMMLSDVVSASPDLSPTLIKRPLRKWPPQKLLQPLVHEGIILGLLLVVRCDRPWQEQERRQIEQMSRTVALAAIIDRERHWAIQALREQQQLQSRQKQLLDNLLHQLRNPLTAIYTFGKLLLKKLPDGDANQRVALNITRESEHLKELLQQLDNFAETRQIDVVPENFLLSAPGDLSPENRSLPLLPSASLQLHPCNILEILEPILASATAVAQEKQLVFSTQIPAVLPPVLASASALREVLGNLVDNALKYTLQGEVQVAVHTDQQQLSVIVSDSGLGIAPQDLPRLFQRSYRGAQANGNIPGTGLGLSIAKELLEQMGGKIQVDSPISYSAQGIARGSRFTVLLPLAAF
jgi:signal transduction histidine kinase